jgi:predicted membrane channel-forming protein YqfA (hemolysin III family)
MHFMGRFLIIAGVILIILGVIFYLSPRVPFLGKLPGDIYIKKDNFHFYMPLGTCLFLGIIISLIIITVRLFK